MAREKAAEIIPSGSTKIEWVAVPSDLSDLVHTFYTMEVGPDGVDEPVPAYSAQLSIIIEGRGELHHASGEISQTGLIHLQAPKLVAGRIVSSGKGRAVCASLTPLGWAALTAEPVNKVHDCVFPTESFVSAALIKQITDWVEAPEAGEKSLEPGFAFLATILRNAPHPVKARHREFVTAMNRWLASEFNPSIESLYSQVPLCERQCQRLSKQLFGAPPSQVLMRHRAIRAAMLLSNPDLPQSLRDELDLAYFDQAHMIRAIRRFTGRTPAGLSDQSLSRKSLDPAGHGATAAPLRKTGNS